MAGCRRPQLNPRLAAVNPVDLKPGLRVGKLTLLHIHSIGRDYTLWRVRCRCGVRLYRTSGSLTSPKVRTSRHACVRCRVTGAYTFDPGQRFGELEVRRLHHSGMGKGRVWDCVCLACGATVLRSSSQLAQGARLGAVQCCLACHRERVRGMWAARRDAGMERRIERWRSDWQENRSLYSWLEEDSICEDVYDALAQEHGPARDWIDERVEVDRWFALTVCREAPTRLQTSVDWTYDHFGNPGTRLRPRQSVTVANVVEGQLCDEQGNPTTERAWLPREVNIDGGAAHRYSSWPTDEERLKQWAGRARIIEALLAFGAIKTRSEELARAPTEDLARVLAGLLRYFVRRPPKRCAAHCDGSVCSFDEGHEGPHSYEREPAKPPARKPKHGPSIYPNEPAKKTSRPRGPSRFSSLRLPLPKPCVSSAKNTTCDGVAAAVTIAQAGGHARPCDDVPWQTKPKGYGVRRVWPRSRAELELEAAWRKEA